MSDQLSIVEDYDCPNQPDPETGAWPCDPDENGICRACGLEADNLTFGEWVERGCP
jgi:hypothetical protein